MFRKKKRKIGETESTIDKKWTQKCCFEGILATCPFICDIGSPLQHVSIHDYLSVGIINIQKQNGNSNFAKYWFPDIAEGNFWLASKLWTSANTHDTKSLLWPYSDNEGFSKTCTQKSVLSYKDLVSAF